MPRGPLLGGSMSQSFCERVMGVWFAASSCRRASSIVSPTCLPCPTASSWAPSTGGSGHWSTTSCPSRSVGPRAYLQSCIDSSLGVGCSSLVMVVRLCCVFCPRVCLTSGRIPCFPALRSNRQHLGRCWPRGVDDVAGLWVAQRRATAHVEPGRRVVITDQQGRKWQCIDGHHHCKNCVHPGFLHLRCSDSTM